MRFDSFDIEFTVQTCTASICSNALVNAKLPGVHVISFQCKPMARPAQFMTRASRIGKSLWSMELTQIAEVGFIKSAKKHIRHGRPQHAQIGGRFPALQPWQS
jgi:hypothetical protein